MDIWYMTLNCAMNLSILVSFLVLVVSGYCLWKANEQTTQKNLPDYQREGTCDMYGFQADVVEVKEDRLLINNVSMLLMNHISSETDGGDMVSPLELERIWFPFSCPTMDTKNPVELILSLKQQEENSPVAKKGDKIWFNAMIQPDAEETQKVGLPKFHLKQVDVLQQISDFEWSDVSYEQLKKSWYLAEQALFNACPFIKSCKGREKPCIMMKGDGGWNRTLVQKQHPELIEDMLTDMPNKLTAGSKCHLGMKIEWLTGKDAYEQGINNKGAVVIYTLQGSVIPAGSRICSIDGKEITDLNCITEILKNHKAGDVVSVTVKCNRKRLQREITLLDDKQVKKLLLDKNPFISRYSYRWWY